MERDGQYPCHGQRRCPPTAARVWDRAHLELETIYSSYRAVPKKVADHTDNFIFPALSSRGQKRSEPVMNAVILRWNLSKDNYAEHGGYTMKPYYKSRVPKEMIMRSYKIA